MTALFIHRKSRYFIQDYISKTYLVILSFVFNSRLRSPQEGLFMGAVDAYDTSNNTYRIRFDRPGLGGTHSVRDEEVLSVDLPETVPLSSFIPQRVARPKPPQSTHPGLLLSSGTSNR